MPSFTAYSVGIVSTLIRRHCFHRWIQIGRTTRPTGPEVFVVSAYLVSCPPPPLLQSRLRLTCRRTPSRSQRALPATPQRALTGLTPKLGLCAGVLPRPHVASSCHGNSCATLQSPFFHDLASPIQTHRGISCFASGASPAVPSTSPSPWRGACAARRGGLPCRFGSPEGIHRRSRAPGALGGGPVAGAGWHCGACSPFCWAATDLCHCCCRLMRCC
jgi:hypothetical protein